MITSAKDDTGRPHRAFRRHRRRRIVRRPQWVCWRYKPPVGSGLARYLLKWLEENEHKRLDQANRFKANDPNDEQVPSRNKVTDDIEVRRTLKAVLEEADRLTTEAQVGFEAAVGHLWRQREDDFRTHSLLAHINQLIGWAFVCGVDCAFPSAQDLYDQAVVAMVTDRAAVISLNYDVLFEEAIQRQRGDASLHYPELRFPPAPVAHGIPVYKLHGSINWFQTSGVARSADIKVARKDSVPLTWDPEGAPHTQRERAVLGSRKELVSALKSDLNDYRPIMALYVHGKPAQAIYATVQREERDEAAVAITNLVMGQGA